MANSSLRVYDNILELLPNQDNPTPLVKLNKVHGLEMQIYAKLEWYNPFGSVKDRIASSLIEDGENKGLTNQKKIIEPTSGNTGIGLISIANIKGYSVKNTVSSEIPVEKKDILRFLGSDVIEISDSLCPDPTAKGGAIDIAKSTVKNYPDKFYMPNQYENEANLMAHYKTTGPEIWKQTEGKVTHLIAGLGTCGSIGGIGKFLKEKNPNIKIIGVYPGEGHDIPGVRSLKQLKVTKLFKPELYDHMIEVSNKESYNMCLRLNREESIIAGPSSGMALVGGLKILKEDEPGLAVIIFPDNIFKYTSFLAKNFPDICKGAVKQQDPFVQQFYDEISEFSRNPGNTVEIEEAKEIILNKQTMISNHSPLDKEPIIIDVRGEVMYSQGHLPGAKNIPLNKLGSNLENLPQDKNAPILTVCNKGNASIKGMAFLRAVGYNNVKSINEGTLGWEEKGLPIEK